MPYGLDKYPTQGYYVGFECLDGNRELIELVDPLPDEGGKPSVINSGRPVRTEHVPTRVKWLDVKHLPMADFDSGPLVSISSRAKALIEQLEPGVHQFLPVEFLDIEEKHLEHRWFLVVCNRLDTIDRQKVRGFILQRGMHWRPIADYLRFMPHAIPLGYDISQPSQLVFNREQIGSAHFWVDKHLSPGVWISDEFEAAYIEKELTGRMFGRERVEMV